MKRNCFALNETLVDVCIQKRGKVFFSSLFDAACRNFPIIMVVTFLIEFRLPNFSPERNKTNPEANSKKKADKRNGATGKCFCEWTVINRFPFDFSLHFRGVEEDETFKFLDVERTVDALNGSGEVDSTRQLELGEWQSVVDKQIGFWVGEGWLEF